MMVMTTAYNTPLILLSIFVAVLASFVALDLVGSVAKAQGRTKIIWLLCGALAMGFGIWSMHYTGMQAGTFIPSLAPTASDSNVLPNSALVTVVTVSTLLVLAVALTSSLFDRALARRTRYAEENARLYHEAEAANITKTRFLANMSHEIRTPLSAVLGFAELLLDDSLEAPQRQEYLDIILRSARSLTQLIDDILDLSKIEMGRLEIENAPLILRPFMRDVLALLKIKADEKGLSLNFVDDPKVPEIVMADAARLRQILVNVLGNALKFTNNGEVDVRLKSFATASGDFVGVEFEDSGIGMTPDQQAKIFRAFSQADNSMSRKFGGTGLGLDISRRLARAMGGDLVLARSEAGRGSTFLLTVQMRLPIGANDASSVVPSQAPARQGAELQGLRILLVEDAPDNQVLVSRLLQKRGAIVELADNGQEGVARALARNFDIILMDIQMPVMNGFEATRQLRAHGLEIPIIALTAHAMREDREACLMQGCTDYVTKPINVIELIPTIRRSIERRRV